MKVSRHQSASKIYRKTCCAQQRENDCAMLRRTSAVTNRLNDKNYILYYIRVAPRNKSKRRLQKSCRSLQYENRDNLKQTAVKLNYTLQIARSSGIWKKKNIKILRKCLHNNINWLTWANIEKYHCLLHNAHGAARAPSIRNKTPTLYESTHSTQFVFMRISR